MEFTTDNLNELDQMLRIAARETIEEMVDPRFDAMEETMRKVMCEEVADMVRYEAPFMIKSKIKEIDHRPDRPEKQQIS